MYLLEGVISRKTFRHAVDVVSIVHSHTIMMLCTHSHRTDIERTFCTKRVDLVGRVIPFWKPFIIVADHTTLVYAFRTFDIGVIVAVRSRAEVCRFVHVEPETIEGHELIKFCNFPTPPLLCIWVEKVWHVRCARPHLSNVVTIPRAILEENAELLASGISFVVFIYLDSCTLNMTEIGSCSRFETMQDNRYKRESRATAQLRKWL